MRTRCRHDARNDARASEHRTLCVALENDGAPAVAGVSSGWRCPLGRIARKARQARGAIGVGDPGIDGALDWRWNRCRSSRGRSRRQHSADDAILGMYSGATTASGRLDVRSRGHEHALRLFPRIHHRRKGRKQELEDGGEKPAEA
ncbi:MAG: hypothetical protein JWL61_1738 [Gemmatimonadetes bacterium]|jgi:hypothetical protein|nr:hypothetical protein [Gemmatimonadota bacterium]